MVQFLYNFLKLQKLIIVVTLHEFNNHITLFFFCVTNTETLKRNF